jgi:hypothetical protein
MICWGRKWCGRQVQHATADTETAHVLGLSVKNKSNVILFTGNDIFARQNASADESSVVRVHKGHDKPKLVSARIILQNINYKWFIP